MRIAIVGGGIAGLAAALALNGSGHEVVLFEGSDRLGGKLRLGTIAGITVDLGAESILARRPEGLALIAAVGLNDRVVHPVTTSAGIWTHGAVRPLPPTVMGIPADLDALEATGILSTRPQSIRVQEPTTDISVGEFVAERVGTEVVDRLVEPLLGGVYAGHAARLSLRAAAPQIAALGDDLLTGATTARASATATGPIFAGLAGGIGQLSQIVADKSGADIRTNATVRQLRRVGEHGVGRHWELVVGPTIAAETIQADAVIVAVPAPSAARLLAEVAPTAAFALAGIDYASMAIITIAIARDALQNLPAGSGFLVPPIDDKAVKAATFSSSKWQWVADAAGADTFVLRCSIGRAGEAALLQHRDPELIDIALADLNEAIGVTGNPIDAIVTRWGGSLPQYDVGHLEKIETIDADIDSVSRLEVCGAAYRGVGIPAVIGSAQGAVARLLDDLGTMNV